MTSGIVSGPKRSGGAGRQLSREQAAAAAMVAEAKAQLPALPEASQQAALELVADGVVDRYS